MQREKRESLVYMAILKADRSGNIEEELKSALYIGKGTRARISAHKADIKKIRNSKYLHADVQLSCLSDADYEWVVLSD